VFESKIEGMEMMKPNPDKLYKFKPCNQSDCRATTVNPCRYGDGNSGRIIEISKLYSALPFPLSASKLNWYGTPFCPKSPNHQKLSVLRA